MYLASVFVNAFQKQDFWQKLTVVNVESPIEIYLKNEKWGWFNGHASPYIS